MNAFPQCFLYSLKPDVKVGRNVSERRKLRFKSHAEIMRRSLRDSRFEFSVASMVIERNIKPSISDNTFKI